MSCDLLPRLLALLEAKEGRASVILSGRIGAGKTRFAERLAADLKMREIEVGGVIQPRLVQNGKTIGYTIRDLATGEERLFANLDPPGIKVGKYFVKEESVAFARRAVERAAKEARVVFIDEVGRLELVDAGHAPGLRTVLESSALPVLVVRREFVDQVVRTFSLGRFVVVPVEEGMSDD
jgi:nucleoside-triphosphatase THEP1